MVSTPRTIVWGRVFGCVALVALLAAAIVLAAMGMAKTTTTTPPMQQVAMPLLPESTTAPPQAAECTFWGDPHLRTFDGGRPSYYGEGEFYIVKSDTVVIQGRYMGTRYTAGLAATNKIAVGGPFLNGHIISVGTLEDGPITVDGASWETERLFRDGLSRNVVFFPLGLASGILLCAREATSRMAQSQTPACGRLPRPQRSVCLLLGCASWGCGGGIRCLAFRCAASRKGEAPSDMTMCTAWGATEERPLCGRLVSRVRRCMHHRTRPHAVAGTERMRYARRAGWWACVPSMAHGGTYLSDAADAPRTRQAPSCRESMSMHTPGQDPRTQLPRMHPRGLRVDFGQSVWKPVQIHRADLYYRHSASTLVAKACPRSRGSRRPTL